MFYRILTKNGVDNTNIDGARNYNFNAGRRSGIVQGALNQGNFFASSSSTIVLDTCELRLCGHRVVIDEAKSISFHNQPSVPIRYSLVAQIIVDNDGGVSFDLHAQTSSTALVQDNLDTNGSGTYELEIGRFTQLTDGTITDVVRTADLITGGAGGGDSEYIRIGTVTTNKISPELDADVDIENTINPDDNKPQTNFTFNLPTSVGTVVSVNGEEKTSINTDITPIASSENLITSGGVHDYPAVTFAESERQKSKNLLNLTRPAITSNVKAYNDHIIINGTVEGYVYPYYSSNLPQGVQLKQGNTYTFSRTLLSGTGNKSFKIELSLRNINDTQIQSVTIPSGENSVTFTIESNDIAMYACSLSFTSSATFTDAYYGLQIEEGSVATEYQPYNGAIVHEKQLETREILYNDSESINIDDSTLTTLAEYMSLFDLDKTKTYKSVIGNASNSNFKALVGNLSNNSSYTICYIKYIGELEGGGSIYELLAYEPLSVVTVAKGYIYYGNPALGAVWTGWTEFK